MRELSSILEQATNSMAAGYFHLDIDGGDSIYRERVYCYELYHQMRSMWPTRTDFYLNGEVDKAAHPILKRLEAAHVKPDFLIHKPGFMSGNHAIIEVKHQETKSSGIKKDLESLSLFVNVVGYERAIYLIYGYEIDPEKFAEKVLNESEKASNLTNIELWFHLSDNSPAFYFTTILARA